jgi:hypothetical protein
MVLDSTKARTYDCETCDISLQFKRNCSNHYEKTNIVLNDNLYSQCPRSIIFNQRELRYLVDVYFDCKENKKYPYSGSLMQQTAFTQELFDYIDGIVNTYRNKKQKEQEAQLKKNQTSSSSKSKAK